MVQLASSEAAAGVITPRADGSDDRQFAVTGRPGDLLRPLQQGRAQAAVLGCAGLLGADRQGLAVDMHLAHQGCPLQVGQAGGRRELGPGRERRK